MNELNAGKSAFFVLLPTLECNLSCDYCFQRRASGRWDVTRAIDVIDRIVAFSVDRGLSSLHVHWQGGEPLLLGASFWQEVLPEARSRAERNGLRLTQGMQTNLVAYTSDMKDLIHEFFNGQVGSSFEPGGGRRYAGANGAERFRKTWLSALERCSADGIQVGTLALLNDRMLDSGAAATLALLRDDLGLRQVRFSLPFRQTGPNGHGFWLGPSEVGEFLADMYRTWCAAGRDRWMEIKPLAHLEARLSGAVPEQPGYCDFVPDCTKLSMAVLPGGDVTLCDNFAHPEAIVPYGNLFEQDLVEIYDGPLRNRMSARVAALTDDLCLGCRYLPVCFGGCLVKSREVGDGEVRRFHYCESYRALFRAVEEEVNPGHLRVDDTAV